MVERSRPGVTAPRGETNSRNDKKEGYYDVHTLRV